MKFLIYDLDNFKNINDTFGHDIGDECLKTTVNSVNEALLKQGDFHARIGGEEFAIILQGITQAGLANITEQILENVRNAFITNNPDVRFTCSIGSTWMSSGSNVTVKKIMSTADKALYKAKFNGRDQAFHIDFSDTL